MRQPPFAFISVAERDLLYRLSFPCTKKIIPICYPYYKSPAPAL